MPNATDSPFQARQDPLSEQPIQHPDARASRGRLTGVIAEEAAPQLARHGVAVLMQEPDDRPVPLAELRSKPLEVLAIDTRAGHRVLRVDPGAGVRMSGEGPLTVASHRGRRCPSWRSDCSLVGIVTGRVSGWV